MTIQWSTIHNHYVIFFGDSIIDIDGKRFFQTKDEIRDWISGKGLDIRGDSIISVGRNPYDEYAQEQINKSENPQATASFYYD